MKPKKRKVVVNIWLIGLGGREEETRSNILRLLKLRKNNVDYRFTIPDGIAVLPQLRLSSGEKMEQHNPYILIVAESQADGKRIAQIINDGLGFTVQVIVLDAYLPAK